MGNHEHPCVVCGENTNSGFNYDCESRHNRKAIKDQLEAVKAYCRLKDKQPCNYHLRNLKELEALLTKAIR